ncbi:Aminodeoxychorismate/anthranilate synthase component 2 [Posidoniimonas polymericola]|uniref:Aminodeoxychorismate/anthranilate synthase component 2 n=1 Tax=Posidoniimonas polymericola TaxID=2528002 RepID=A0A5C5XUW3_9BACT|nr:aminodeoxychorismate/anthranilate synthase component II [Posidoniimonas polymericola]TWT66289.1 Aminodeoxychorismate/anthranilate synthase component 2 [Posidoniimonas polymericola]
MILLIDNYDSFVHNLARYFRLLGCETVVVRNDALTVGEVRRLAPAAVVLSPGPCTPCEAGISVDLVRRLSGELPILGICLGHQAIVAAFGGEVTVAQRPLHGQATAVRHDDQGVFAGLPNPMPCGRYHSLIADPTSLPDALVPTAWTDDGVLMAVRHRGHPTVGLQFHPESILTERGLDLLRNFVSQTAARPTSIGRA